jgi:TldD protein
MPQIVTSLTYDILTKMLSRAELEEILTAALQRGGDFADIFMESTDQTGITLEDKKIDRLSTGTDAGAGIRVILNNISYYASSHDTSFDGLIALARALSNSVNSTKKIKEVRLRPTAPAPTIAIKRRPNTVPIEEKVAVIQKASDAAWGYGEKIRQVTVRYTDVNQGVTVANSNGIYVEDNRIRTRFAVQITAVKDNVLQTGYEAPGGTVGFELFEDHDAIALTRKAAERALLMLDAKHAPTGPMPIVMSSEAGGTMVHEACGHALEADFIQKGTSVFANKIGKKVAADCVTVIDDTTLPGKYGTYKFDDEGTPAQKTTLIENGILKGYMSDYLNSHMLGMVSSGNGRRESYRTKPVPRMTNTMIQSGMTDPKEIIASVKNGLFVKRMGGGEVNVTNGDFVFEVTEAYIIENGEIKSPVRGAMLTGNGPEVLKTIDMVGWDLGFQTGVCGKYDHAPVSDAQPTIRIPSLIVGGR